MMMSYYIITWQSCDLSLKPHWSVENGRPEPRPVDLSINHYHPIARKIQPQAIGPTCHENDIYCLSLSESGFGWLQLHLRVTKATLIYSQVHLKK